MEGENAPRDIVQMDDVRRDFFTFLWEYCEEIREQSLMDGTGNDGLASAGASGLNVERVYVYRCA